MNYPEDRLNNLKMDMEMKWFQFEAAREKWETELRETFEHSRVRRNLDLDIANARIQELEEEQENSIIDDDIRDLLINLSDDIEEVYDSAEVIRNWLDYDMME